MMNKKQILKIIKEECYKIEEKSSMPMDIQWDDVFDDGNPEMYVEVELAYNCIKRVIDILKHDKRRK